MKRICLILLLCPALASASAIKRLDSLRVAAFRMAGLNESGNARIDDATANLYINMAIQRISADLPAVEKAASVVCSDKVASYNITDTAFSSLVWARIWKSQTAQGEHILYPLLIIPSSVLYEAAQSGKRLPIPEDEPDYAYAWAGSLHVQPLPHYEDTVKYGYLAVGLHLSSDSDTTDMSPTYRDLIYLWAAYLICVQLKKYEVATFLKTEYDARYMKSQRVVQK